MQVFELIDILRDHPPDAEVELAFVAPVSDEAPEISVDRYTVDGVMPWTDEETGEPLVWLVGGDADDIEEFIDAVEDLDDQP